MKITNRMLAILVIIITFVFLAVASFWVTKEVTFPEGYSPEVHALRLKCLTFILEVYRTIVVGFLVAMLGILAPNILSEAKYEFERQKKGREVYSKAKTGIDYFRFDLADLDLKDARNYIHEIHELKHLADTYIRNDPQIAQWHYKKPYDAYRIIMEYLEAVENIQHQWDFITYESRRRILQEVYEKIKPYT